MLSRYIENELIKPDFLEDKTYKQIKEEIFLFVYFAGPGCVDNKQYYVLNEDTVDKCFWKAEEKLRTLTVMAGTSLKMFVVFDTCREDIKKPQKTVREFHEYQSILKNKPEGPEIKKTSTKIDLSTKQ